MLRRHFVRSAAALTAAGLSAPLRAASAARRPLGSIHIFSKHLQFLAGDALAATAATLGFDGVDLTVRPGGHIAPDRAATELPRLAAALRSHGLPPVMATTAILGLDEPHADATLGALADAGFHHVRLGWPRIHASESPTDAVARARPALEALASRCARLGLCGSLQNHAGAQYLGATTRHLAALLHNIDPAHLALQFDLRHAMVQHGPDWLTEFELAAPRIATVDCKDFARPHADASPPSPSPSAVTDVPLGSGEAVFPDFLRRLHGLGRAVPAALHLEYPLGGAEHGHRTLTQPVATVLEAMRRDLAVLRRWNERTGT